MAIIYDWANPEDAAKVILEAKIEEREQCYKDSCRYCENGIEVYELFPGGRWFHKTGNEIERNDSCRASRIRERVARNQNK